MEKAYKLRLKASLRRRSERIMLESTTIKPKPKKPIRISDTNSCDNQSVKVKTFLYEKLYHFEEKSKTSGPPMKKSDAGPTR